MTNLSSCEAPQISNRGEGVGLVTGDVVLVVTRAVPNKATNIAVPCVGVEPEVARLFNGLVCRL